MRLFRCDICESVSDIEPNYIRLTPHDETQPIKVYGVCDECYLTLYNHFEQSISNYNQDDYNHFQSGKVSEVQGLLDKLIDQQKEG